ncbi:FAD-dependent oxidoreductase [Falsirhodobacter sp. 20TX0035]|uniref:FAD-dependent oxidoreductase n=1 Tax=Falsirhodobacter sp. 20TX0035 TaxID=3022019 RepID=UPI002330D373|nr:FAD-dependent oxidoreductase [Falsirhodobacter sp. 20TX0035]MDB6453700.1 FAD-dependent oxidoreductase [Falsirhodobacter sp. 20TX0035]
MSSNILIVGGGLAGLTAAVRLNRAGLSVRLLEARDRLGGRIHSVDASGAPSADGFDLGPSWFWPETQPSLAALIAELGLQAFPQNSEGDVLFHRMSREAPRRFRNSEAAAPSLRLAGGTLALIRALAAQLPEGTVRLNAPVRQIALTDTGVAVTVDAEVLEADRVLLALPPRLAEATLRFIPTLDAASALRWKRTPTWMAPHAKVFALYDHPFWREAGLSGTAQSMAGPLMEIHDATTASGKAALFGFVGMPAEQRARVGKDAILSGALAQFQRLFGEEAGRPVATLYKDWAADPLTATPDDQVGGMLTPDPQGWVGGPWQHRLLMAGSETSPVEPGYLAGAVEAAQRAVAEVLDAPPPAPKARRETYRAMQVTEGRLELVERPTPAPGVGEVLLDVEACGICGADRSDIARAENGRVPGHEVVGRIAALGEGVTHWRIGQRVGVGRMGGPCLICDQCRRGAFNLCRDQPTTGVSRDGGYAEKMLARASGLVSIPDDLSSEEAAPILCAGIATFNALRKSGAEPGDLVAVFGIGGLGHMAVQYARRMGFRVAAIGRGDIREDALRLGAHIYIDGNAAETLAGMGGAAAILTTVGDAAAIQSLLPGLAPQGRLVLLGIAKDPLAVSVGHLVGGERAILGSITGTPHDTERALDFSVLTHAHPQIEVMPLDRATEAFERMASGAVRFRMVLRMGA